MRIKVNGRKYKLNFEKFIGRLYVVIYICMIAFALTHLPEQKPTTWQWADACDNGISWNEYMEVQNG